MSFLQNLKRHWSSWQSTGHITCDLEHFKCVRKKIFRVQMYERALKCSIMIKNALQSSILLKFLKLPSTTWLSYFLQEGHSNSLSYQIIFLPVRLNTRNKARVFLFCKTVTSIFTKILTFFKIAPHFIYFTIRTLPITL